MSKSIALTFLFLVGGILSAQNLLDKRITVIAVDMKLGDVMHIIEERGQFSFSYGSKVIDETRTLTLRAEKRPVREILVKMFGDELKFKERGNYVILTKAPAGEKKYIDGYVEDSDGQPLANATLYDESSLLSANTNDYGYYRMKVPRRINTIQLSAIKTLYTDTVVPVQLDSTAHTNIVLQELPDDSTSKFEKEVNVIWEKSSTFMVKTWGQMSDFMFPPNPELLNVNDTIYREFQFSVLPFIGTNRNMSGRVINNWSFNLLGGYNMGVRKGEIGGLFNIDRGDVSWVQMAGLTNMTGGNFHGAQFAGLFNLNRRETIGAQFAGIGNINGGKGEGFQGGGVMNINFSDYHGTQAAGTMNVNIGTYKGVQLAGLLNVNIGHLDGVQVSSLLNIAGNVKGSQIGLVNLCDSIQGVPIGLLSFVANGYHKFEISTDDLYPVGVSLRSGVPEFYNIVTAGFDPVTLNDSVFWTFGYGIGSAPKLARNLYLNFDLTCNAVVKANVSDDLNLLNRFTLGLEWQIAKGFGITAGATLNGYLRESDADPVVFRNQSPEMIYSHTFSNDLLLDSWLGWRFGIRFF